MPLDVKAGLRLYHHALSMSGSPPLIPELRMQWESLKKWWMFDDPRSYGARQLMLGAAERLRRTGKQVLLHPLDPNDTLAD